MGRAYWLIRIDYTQSGWPKLRPYRVDAFRLCQLERAPYLWWPGFESHPRSPAVMAQFKRFRKIASVCPSAWNNPASTGRILMKFDICVYFKSMLRKSSFRYTVTRITGTLREDLRTLTEFFLE